MRLGYEPGREGQQHILYDMCDVGQILRHVIRVKIEKITNIVFPNDPQILNVTSEKKNEKLQAEPSFNTDQSGSERKTFESISSFISVVLVLTTLSF